MQILKKCFWTAPSCAPTSIPPVPLKKGPQAIGRSRGGLTTKIHALVEGLGNLARFVLTEGQAHDITQAATLLDIDPEAVVADKAFDADPLRQNIAQRGAKAVIPPRSNRNAPASYDRHQYKHRNLIERHFCRIKPFRRIATRYEKLASRFASFIALVAAFVWLT